MKKIFLLISIFALVTLPSATVVNQLVASVGSIAITSYDVQQMRDFEAEIMNKRPTANEALEKLISMSALLVIAENYSEYYMDEAELRKNINSLTNNPSDPTSEQRKIVYEKYSEMYRMAIRSDKVKRGMMYSDIRVKESINKPIPDREARDFYNKNKEMFMDSPYPKFDLMIFAVESNPKWTLSELGAVEDSMQELAKDLDSSSDYNALRRKYSSLRFTAYSGRTGLFAPDVLILQKKIPDEVLGISLQPSLNLGMVNIPIKKNTGIFIPQPIPFRSTGNPTYLTMKIMDIVQPSQLSFDEARPKIEEGIKYQRAESAIEDSIKRRIAEGEITLTPVGNNYKNVFNKFK